MKNKFYLEANIELQQETAALKEKAIQAIKLPEESERQPDLQYFSAIFVSSGANLNHAFFAGSELVAAEGTIANKALDMEHSESEIIGHLIERVFIDKDGNKLELSELLSLSSAELDKKDMHIAIAGIIYKTRFPHISKEVAENKWKVSMECFFTDYDVKVGNVIMSRQEAEALGIASIDNTVGKLTKIIKGGKEIALATMERVLRKICFSGCGIVKNPANPPSIILETAKTQTNKELFNKEEIVVLNYDTLDNTNNINVTLDTIETVSKDSARDGNLDDTTGICLGYKKTVLDKAGTIVSENWCSLYDKGCTSFSRDTTDPNCLRTKEMLQEVQQIATARMKTLIKEKSAKDKRVELLNGVQAALREAVKTQSR